MRIQQQTDRRVTASCCSLEGDMLPVTINPSPLRELVVENAQHESHCSRYFTVVTAPFTVQYTAATACCGCCCYCCCCCCWCCGCCWCCWCCETCRIRCRVASLLFLFWLASPLSPFFSLSLFPAGLSDPVSVADRFGRLPGCSPGSALSPGTAHVWPVVNTDSPCVVPPCHVSVRHVALIMH